MSQTVKMECCPITIKEVSAWYYYYLDYFLYLVNMYPLEYMMIVTSCIGLILLLSLCKPRVIKKKDDGFQKILDQVGEDEDSWPVMLVKEVIMLKNIVNEMKNG